MRGETVIIRAFGGEPLVRRIWEVSPDIIDICDEVGYQRLRFGDKWIPIGFPRWDVFRYDPAVLERLMREWQDNPSIWDSLTVWMADSEVKTAP